MEVVSDFWTMKIPSLRHLLRSTHGVDTCVLANELLGRNTSQLQQERTKEILVIFAPFSAKIRDLTASRTFASVKALDLKAEGTNQCEGVVLSRATWQHGRSH